MSCLKGIRVFAETVLTDWELNGSSGKLNGKIIPFLINIPVFYPPKIPENLLVFWCFQVVEIENIGEKWAKFKMILNCLFSIPLKTRAFLFSVDMER